MFIKKIKRGDLEIKQNNKLCNSEMERWYFEKWHQYQNKKDAIQRLYFDVLKWSADRSGAKLLPGTGGLALDVGSAHGYVVDLLCKLGYKAFGCEMSKFYVQSYAKKIAQDFLICDAQLLPFRNKKLRLITAFEVLEHLPKYRSFLNQCHDVLKESGALLLTTPQANLKGLNLKFWSDYAIGNLVVGDTNIDKHCHEFFSAEELKYELNAAKFSKCFIETWWFAAVPPVLFNRYFVGQFPMLMIPHLRCLAVK